MSKGDIEQEAEVKPGRPATARQVCAMALVFIALAGGVLLAIRRRHGSAMLCLFFCACPGIRQHDIFATSCRWALVWHFCS